MNKIIWILSMLIGISIFSCNPALKKIYKLDRQFSFKTRQDYIDFIQQPAVLDVNQVIYLDSASYVKFGIESLQQDSSMVYFGSFLNDSVCIKKSQLLKDKQSCYGRMLHDIENVISLKSYNDSLLSKKINLKKYNMYSLAGDKKIAFSTSPDKIKVILIYGYSLGTYYNKFYKEIRQTQKNNPDKINLYIITMDPVYRLK